MKTNCFGGEHGRALAELLLLYVLHSIQENAERQAQSQDMIKQIDPSADLVALAQSDTGWVEIRGAIDDWDDIPF